MIYSAPPSSQDLRLALESVKPAKVYLFAVSPQQEKTDAFLSRLAGLAKFVINQREGKATIQELAGVTGQREKAVQIGLEWLAAGGHISIESQNGICSDCPREKGRQIRICRRSSLSPSGGSWRKLSPIAPTLRAQAASSLFDLSSY